MVRCNLAQKEPNSSTSLRKTPATVGNFVGLAEGNLVNEAAELELPITMG